MPQYRYLELLGSGPVSRVRLLTQGPLGGERIAELAEEWNSVADHAECRTLVVNCSKIEVLSSEMLSKLVLLQRRLKQKDGKVVLCGIRGEVREVLSWTRLDRFFEIQDDEEQETPVLT